MQVGMATCRALKEAGFAVFGTTRTAKSGKRLADAGIAPVTANYTVRADLDRAISETGCKKVFVITDYWGAAKNSKKKEVAQGIVHEPSLGLPRPRSPFPTALTVNSYHRLAIRSNVSPVNATQLTNQPRHVGCCQARR
jgi:hypothetical protein